MMDDEMKVPTTEDIIEDMKKNPDTWAFMPKGKYTKELEIKDEVKIKD